jgi:hypothetical protein
VYGQKFDSAGQKVGGEFQINQETNDTQRYPEIAMRPNGDFVVTWISKLQDGDNDGIYARVFSWAK